MTGHEGQIAGLALHPTGLRAATASWDGTVRLWNLGGAGLEERRFNSDPGFLPTAWHSLRRAVT